MSAASPNTEINDDRDRDKQQQEDGPVAANTSTGPSANQESNGEAEGNVNNHGGEGDEDEEEEEEEDDEEPKLKYVKLTGNLSNVYRADSTSAFLVAGDKMVVGTHNGSIHVLSVPTLQNLRMYRAHSAMVTSVSVSPVPPKPVVVRSDGGGASIYSPTAAGGKNGQSMSRAGTSTSTSGPRTPQRPQQAPVPNTPNNQIYIATSSQDGHVCVQSLVDPQDVQLRNFARPINAVALSPDYKNDRTYISGGLAGELILTVGGKAGVSENANTNSSAAAGGGWLGAIGLGGNIGRDQKLHSGEGAISSVKWSLSGKWVAWVNEEGIKIMRSALHLSSEAQDDAYTRIAHAPRPDVKAWDDMVGVWKARCEWVDEQSLESDDLATGGGHEDHTNGTTSVSTLGKGKKKIEKLVVGWGNMAWILHVQSGSSTPQGPNAKPKVGSADIMHKLEFRDCIISGISLYTPSLLAIMAYRTRDDDDKPIQQATPSRGRRQRHNGLPPQLRLIRVADGEELELDELPISRFEELTSQDYHLGTLYMPPPLPEKAVREQKGTLGGLWDATRDAAVTSGGYATRIFSSSASVLSGDSGERTNGRAMSFSSGRQGSIRDVSATSEIRRNVDAHPYMLEPGLKLFIQSPYDCVLAVKRELSDHLEWLMKYEQYEDAWQLIDEHPEAVDNSTSDMQSLSSVPGTPTRGGANGSLADFFASDDSSQTTGVSALRAHNSIAQKEKRRVGDLWLQQLVSSDQWVKAGEVAGRVLGTSARWEHWAWTFAQADKFDEIMPYIPSTQLKPPLPSLVYEVILGHYIVKDVPRLTALLEQWDPELFDVRSVISAIEDRLSSGEVSEETSENGVKGQDWRVLMEALGRLYLADGRSRDALKCFIALQDADKAFALIKEEKLLDAVADDIPGLIMLRVTKEQVRKAPLSELEESSSEAIHLLVDEAHRGTIPTSEVVRQLQQRKDDTFQPFLFFYFRALWNDSSSTGSTHRKRHGIFDRSTEEGHMLVEDHADLAVLLFAEYDRSLLLTFLKSSTLYSYEKAAKICQQRHYIPELVHILSKIGQTKDALELIIGELGDVTQAIAFVKDHSDLWDDLLEYSMNKPTFIRGLLEEVGAAASFNPIDVVRRIPNGLEIEGLKHGIQRLVREFEIQMSISEGVAKVLRGEVGMGMDTLRAGRKKAVRFEVTHESKTDVEIEVKDVPTTLPAGKEELPTPKRLTDMEKLKKKPGEKYRAAEPGCCVGCGNVFHEDGMLSSSLRAIPLHLTNIDCFHRIPSTHRLRLWTRLPPILSPRRTSRHAGFPRSEGSHRSNAARCGRRRERKA